MGLNKKSKNSENENKRSHKCQICCKTFAQKRYLNQHKKIHSGIRAFECTYCKKKFLLKCSLVIHTRSHTGEKPYKCNLCNKSFSGPSNYSYHKKMHSGEKKFECDYCLKKFIRKDNIENHLRVHTGEKPYKCNLCNKAFSVISNCNMHKKIHSSEKKFECDYCLKGFIKKADLRKHLGVHTVEKLYKCKFCDKLFKYAKSLHCHEKIHADIKSFKHDICKNSFISKTNLRVHIQAHSFDKSKKFKPTGKKLKNIKQKKNVSQVKKQKKLNDITQSLFNCNDCGKVFYKKGSVILHLKGHLKKQISPSDSHFFCANKNELDSRVNNDNTVDDNFQLVKSLKESTGIAQDSIYASNESSINSEINEKNNLNIQEHDREQSRNPPPVPCEEINSNDASLFEDSTEVSNESTNGLQIHEQINENHQEQTNRQPGNLPVIAPSENILSNNENLSREKEVENENTSLLTIKNDLDDMNSTTDAEKTQADENNVIKEERKSLVDREDQIEVFTIDDDCDKVKCERMDRSSPEIHIVKDIKKKNVNKLGDKANIKSNADAGCAGSAGSCDCQNLKNKLNEMEVNIKNSIIHSLLSSIKK